MSQFWIQQAGKTFGPFSAAQLKDLAATSKIRRDDSVGKSADGPWTPAANVRGLGLGTPAPAPQQKPAQQQKPTQQTPTQKPAQQKPTPQAAPRQPAPQQPAAPALQPLQPLQPMASDGGGLPPLPDAGIPTLAPLPGDNGLPTLAPLPGNDNGALDPLGGGSSGLQPLGGGGGLQPLGGGGADPLGALQPIGGDPLMAQAVDPLAAPATGGMSPLKPLPAGSTGGIMGGGKKKAGAGAILTSKPVLIGGGAVVGVALLGILITMLVGMMGGGGRRSRGADGNVVDMTYLPANIDMLGFVDVDRLVNSDMAQAMLSNPMAQMGMGQITEATGLTLQDVDSVTFGAPSQGSFDKLDSENMTVVVRLKKDLDTSKLPTPQSQDGKQWYPIPGNGPSIFLPDGRTVVFAKQQALMKAMSNGDASTRREKFDFAHSGHDFFVALAPDSISLPPQARSLTRSAAMAPPEVRKSAEAIAEGMEEVRAFCFGGSISRNDLDAEFQIAFKSSSTSRKVRSALNDILSEARTQLKKESRMPEEMKSRINKVLKSLGVDADGDAVSVSVRIDESDLKSLPIPNNPFSGVASGFGGGAPPLPFGGGGTSNPLSKARDAARRAQSANNLKQIGLGYHNYHDTHRSFPVNERNKEHFGPDGKPHLSWRVHLLPFVEQRALYEQFALDQPWNSPQNMRLLTRMPNIYKRPNSNAAPGRTTYLALSGPGAVLESGSGNIRGVHDGTSNTGIVVEVSDAHAVEWIRPDEYAFDPGDPGNWCHGVWNDGGFNVLFGDGSVQFIDDQGDRQQLRNLFQQRDGNLLELEQIRKR